VKIALSKWEFIGVGALKEHSWANGNQRFCMYLPPFCRSYLQKCNTFKVCGRPKKSSTFKGKCAVNTENFIYDL